MTCHQEERESSLISSSPASRQLAVAMLTMSPYRDPRTKDFGRTLVSMFMPCSSMTERRFSAACRLANFFEDPTPVGNKKHRQLN